MDETMPRPVETDPRLTERQSLVDISDLSQVTFLYIIGRDQPCS
jgi:hypothetical protein